MVAVSDGAEFDQVIRQLLSATSPQEACRLLRDFPWLTSKETHRTLTRMIAEKRRKRDLLAMTCLMGCRGLLSRCRSGDNIDNALSAQPGWPLINQGPLNQLLALSGNASADERIRMTNVASNDVDSEEEPDFRGLIDFHLGWGYQIKADAGSQKAMDRAIEHFEAAEAAWQQADSLFSGRFLGQTQEYLGRLYLERRHCIRSEDIETALRWFKKSCRTFGDKDVHQRLKLYMLIGKTYLGRIQGEPLQNIEEGIDYYHKAHQLAAQQDQERRLGEIEHSLAFAYRLRLRGHPADNYERGRELAEQALERFDQHRSPEDWARTRAELATIYAHRQRGDRGANLETAIEHANEALEIYHPDTHPRQWTLVQLTLGNMYCDRVSGLRWCNDLLAVRCFRNVLKYCDPESEPLRWSEAMNNLATVYASRRGTNYRKAINCYRQALEFRTPETMPDRALQTARNLGALHFEHGAWSEAIEAYRVAQAASDTLYLQTITQAGKRAEIGRGAGVANHVAYALAHEGKLEEAVLGLERGRARLLAEALARDRAVLDHADDQERAEYEAAVKEIRNLERELRATELNVDEASPTLATGRSFVQIARDMSLIHEKLDKVVATIRAHPSYENFLTQPVFDDVLRAVRPDVPLVYLVATPAGGLALVAHHDGVDHIPLRSLTDKALLARVRGWFEAYFTHLEARKARAKAERERTEDLERTRSAEEYARRKWDDILVATTRWLWNAVMEPIVATLSGLGYRQATLIPTGFLTFLPLCAAWRPGNKGAPPRYALDDVAFAYAPSALALTYAQQVADDVCGDKLFAVNNPDGSLRYATQEVSAVVGHFKKSRQVAGYKATCNTVLRALPKYDVLHFACHGSNDWQSPLQSALWMYGELPLTVSDLLDLKEGAQVRLAFLSACETGLIGTELPDEVVGLATGFMQAGAAGVVSTLWSVDDESTASLAERFYENWKVENMSPLEALVGAQQWLRNDSGRDQWKHPYHWAAFAMTGV